MEITFACGGEQREGSWEFGPNLGGNSSAGWMGWGPGDLSDDLVGVVVVSKASASAGGDRGHLRAVTEVRAMAGYAWSVASWRGQLGWLWDTHVMGKLSTSGTETDGRCVARETASATTFLSPRMYMIFQLIRDRDSTHRACLLFKRFCDCRYLSGL